MSQTLVAPKTYTLQFWLLCTSSLLFFASFNMIIPELPSFLTSLGGGEYKGLIISLFTVTAMLSRPFSGKLADKIGRVPVMMIGATVSFICSAIYPILSTVIGFFLLRLVHGFSTGFTPTGQAAYLSDIIPPQKRGEAMGYIGTAGTVGMAAGPAIGGALASSFSINVMFYCSSLFAFSAIGILIGIRETLSEKKKFSPGMLKVKKEDLFEPRVIMPCVVMGLCAYSFGAVYTVIPDFGEFVGITNKGLLFTYFTMASLLVRLIGGKASDYYGRAPVLKLSTLLIIAAMVTVGFATTKFMLLSGMVIYGLAHGITSPTLLAWATDLSDINHKGRGMSSLYVFMEFGIGVGAFASGIIYGNSSANFKATFFTGAFLAGIAFLYLMTRNMLDKPQYD
ncbi:MAG: MFS transporter [Cyclobacteriaceae bacterium]